MKGNSLELLVDGPTYKSKRFDTVPYIDASASLDGNSLVLNVVNRHQDQADGGDDRAGGQELLRRRSRSRKSTAPTSRRKMISARRWSATRNSSVTASGNSLTYSFPPHSYTQLKATLA